MKAQIVGSCMLSILLGLRIKILGKKDFPDMGALVSLLVATDVPPRFRYDLHMRTPVGVLEAGACLT